MVAEMVRTIRGHMLYEIDMCACSEPVNLTVGALNSNNSKTVKATEDFKLNAHVSRLISYIIP